MPARERAVRLPTFGIRIPSAAPARAALRSAIGALGSIAAIGAVAGWCGLASPAAAAGPDVVVYELTDIENHGVDGGVRGYSIGTTSCNVGDAPLHWCDEPGGCSGLDDRQHPVIAQNLYRLRWGRFRQIGMSWLKHGFASTNSFADDCRGAQNQTCQAPPRGEHELGVGCTDTYGAFLNGFRPLGMRSEVDPTTGFFPYPETWVPESGTEQLVRVAESDLAPAQNPDALYFAEGHYVSDNDALAGNGFNNASYQPVTVGPAPQYDLTLTGSTVRDQPALRAWQAVDPAVQIFTVDVPGAGTPTERFHVGRRVTQPSPGVWHYEYAVHNLNSARAAQRFAVDFRGPATIGAVGFADIPHHSGEPYSTADWTAQVDAAASAVSWRTALHAQQPNANALRWGTLFNFWFDASQGPAAIDRHVLTLFAPGGPGTPCRVAFSFAAGFVFADDFETGDLCSWSGSQ